jgi:DNA repair photolyase
MECRSALHRVRGMAFPWSLNPYRGCAHGCVYCYARITHTYLDLDPGEDFRTRLFAKVNVVAVLEGELARPGWRRELVAVGTATDPYQPLEGTLCLTRGCLEALAHARTPVTVVTKGPMVRRDTDVLQELARRAGCTVCVSVPTVDERLWRLTEPGTAAPRHRLLAVRHLARAGVRVGVLLAPLLPGLTCDAAHIEAAVRAAAEHEACFVDADVARLGPRVKEVYLDFVGTAFPHLLPLYQHLYPDGRAPAALHAWVHRRVEQEVLRQGVSDRRPLRLGPPPQPQERSLLPGWDRPPVAARGVRARSPRPPHPLAQGRSHAPHRSPTR